MKIKQLITQLQKLDPNLEVVLSSDPEGNSFGILQDIDVDNDYVFCKEERQFIIKGKTKGCVDCVVLFP